MKPILVWLALAAAVFGGGSGGYHFYLQDHPQRMLIALDSSYPMAGDWMRVKDILHELEGKRYTEYNVITEKRVVQGWQSHLRLGNLAAYAPRNLTWLASSEAQAMREQADRALLITNAPSRDLSGLEGWELVRVGG